MLGKKSGVQACTIAGHYRKVGYVPVCIIASSKRCTLLSGFDAFGAKVKCSTLDCFAKLLVFVIKKVGYGSRLPMIICLSTKMCGNVVQLNFI